MPVDRRIAVRRRATSQIGAERTPVERLGTVADDDVLDEFRRFRASRDRELRNRLVLRHRHIAEYHARRFTGRGEALGDLVQVALLALVKAVERFDPEYGVTFGTFAEPTIVGELRRHFRDATWPVHVSRRAQELHLAMAATRERLSHVLGRSPTTSELAAAAGVSVDDVLHAMEAGNAYRTTLLEASHALGDGDLAAADDRLALREALSNLSTRDREIFRLRFTEGLSQSEIAHRLGVSQVHVSRLLRSGLAELRARLEPAERA